MARRESIKYSLQYVLSALDELGLDDDDNDADLLTKSAVFHAITLHEANALIGRVVSAYQARPRKEPMHEKSWQENANVKYKLDDFDYTRGDFYIESK